MLIIAAISLLLGGNALALEVAGVTIEPTVRTEQQDLKLNGYGIRKKFFFKIYLGALYTAQPVSSRDDLLRDPNDKLIRMTFIHSKVDREKITEAFAEGFEKNSPDFAGSPEAKEFLAIFTDDFVKGDVVDLELDGSGRVAARQNGKTLGTFNSSRLRDAILLIYFGDSPADEDLKEGMLAAHS